MSCLKWHMENFLHSVYSGLICCVIWIIFCPSIIYSTEKKLNGSILWWTGQDGKETIFSLSSAKPCDWWRRVSSECWADTTCRAELFARVLQNCLWQLNLGRQIPGTFWGTSRTSEVMHCKLFLAKFLCGFTDFCEGCRYVFGFGVITAVKSSIYFFTCQI